MTVKEMANTIELTNTPVRCSACFNQNPSLKHIDMDAACDRGYGDEAAVRVAYDDLVLCESCVKEAAAILNMIDKDDDTIATLTDERDKAQAEGVKQRKYSDLLEAALEEHPQDLHLDKRHRPRIEMELPIAR